MADLSKFVLRNLFSELQEKPLQGFLSESSFKERADYIAQKPTIYPLGELHFHGDAGMRGGVEIWLNEDETIEVQIDRDGTIDWVSER